MAVDRALLWLSRECRLGHGPLPGTCSNLQRIPAADVSTPHTMHDYRRLRGWLRDLGKGRVRVFGIELALIRQWLVCVEVHRLLLATASGLGACVCLA
jgi:hypothetical protein